MIEPEEFKNHF